MSFSCLTSTHIIPVACAIIAGMITGYACKQKDYIYTSPNHKQLNPLHKHLLEGLSTAMGFAAVLGYFNKLIAGNDLISCAIFGITTAVEYKFSIGESVIKKLRNFEDPRFPGQGQTTQTKTFLQKLGLGSFEHLLSRVLGNTHQR